MNAIAITAFKGGVGKTTVTANLGAALAERGHRVALVDMEPSANLSLMFGYGRNDVLELGRSTVDVLRGDCTFDEAAAPIDPVVSERTNQKIRENLRIIPSLTELQDVNNELVTKPRGEDAMGRALRASTSFDWALFDCQPGNSYLTINAIVAAKHILVPTKPHEQTSIEGIAQVAEIVRALGQVEIPAEIIGVLSTHVDRRDRAYKDNIEQLDGIDVLLPVELPYRKNVTTVQNDRPYFLAHPNHINSDLFRQVAIELEKSMEAAQ